MKEVTAHGFRAAAAPHVAMADIAERKSDFLWPLPENDLKS